MEKIHLIPESHQDLLSAEVAALSTIGRDGYPQVTAVWFLYDEDGMLRISMKSSRQKVKNLGERPVCTLFILDRDNPGRTLEIRAKVHLTADVNYSFADKIAKKYGVDIRKWDQVGETRVVVTLLPVKVNING